MTSDMILLALSAFFGIEAVILEIFLWRIKKETRKRIETYERLFNEAKTNNNHGKSDAEGTVETKVSILEKRVDNLSQRLTDANIPKVRKSGWLLLILTTKGEWVWLFNGPIENEAKADECVAKWQKKPWCATIIKSRIEWEQ